MFRDSRGVVHTVCSSEPLRDLPAGAAKALQDALLSPGGFDREQRSRRCDAVVELLERWQDSFFAALEDDVDPAEEARVAADAGIDLAELEADYDDDADGDELALPGLELGGVSGDPELDQMIELAEAADDEHDPRRVLPEELVAVLERELLLLPVRVRLEALVAAVELVGRWHELLDDVEKLVGHLVVGHGSRIEPGAVDGHDDLVERHGVLHAATGPGHPEQ